MNMIPANDYQIANRISKEKKMAALRAEVLAKSPEKALDAILDAPLPATFVQSFPDQDLHFLMHYIGEDDFLPILSLATSQQWEYIMDVEVWNRDRLDIASLTRVMELLFKADPHRLLRWTITEKTEFLEYYLFRNLEIRVREHDEDPSDFGDGFETIDSVIYFRFPNIDAQRELEAGGAHRDGSLCDSEDLDASVIENGIVEGAIADEESDFDADVKNEIINSAEASGSLITDMLNTLADMDIGVFQALMFETSSVIPAETEEEQFRLKNIRLAEKGFLPYHEAVAIYQPVDPDSLKPRPSFYLENNLYAGDLPLPPVFPFTISERKNIFAASLSLINIDTFVILQSEFAFLVNSFISTEKNPARSISDIKKCVESCCSFLSLGLEVLHLRNIAGVQETLNSKEKYIDERDCSDLKNSSDMQPLTPESASDLILKYALKDIFRVGSGEGLKLKQKLQNWYSRSWVAAKKLKLTFLDEKWMGIAGGLLLKRPLYFDNYETGVLYRPFASIEDIRKTAREVNFMVSMDAIMASVEPEYEYLDRPYVTWKAVILTMWANQRMSEDADVIDSDLPEKSFFIPLGRFKRFFEQIFADLSGGDASFEEERVKKKISSVVRQDFVAWLSSYGDIAVNLGFIDDLFDELEDEYGRVESDDIDGDLVTHFIIDKIAAFDAL
ncbi:putative metal-dependent hydrolase of the beta-lactamase superfamily [Desulfamplus magnetovallimortis]|uniref:Putative metal-dependent hydrolase of the beta-lactamase superfamily n=1 Tax=Desulfamplus magnetovallimortis TaxID=1246637 RepID=A0A1W1H5D4_9BACT|nr:DUF6178 family protein [Desulfamplus magnetovallimortis]SLM27656.1 putative metal-dependent hydrolase of the beta-lactamase superfamily [Desulfamplus magnetovallimortis]